MYHGDIRLGDTLDVKFTTRSFTTGAPTTLSGSPVISAYVGNGTTEITAGITLTVDFDSRTGLNNVRIVASSGNGFATASNIELVITTGTVGGVSVVGEVIGAFSIECRSALMPTTAARTLVVDAAGLADANTVKVGPTGAGTAQTARDIGLSVLLSNGTGTGQLKLASGYVAMTWADIAAPTTTVNLSGTTVGTVTLVTTTTTLTNLPAITAGWLTATGIAADAITAAKIADGAIDTATFASGTTIPRCTLTDTLTTYTGNTVQTGDSFARIGATGSGLTSLAPSATALSNVQWTNTLATNLGTLASHDPGATIGTSTLTQTQVSGGAYALNSASFAFNAALDFTTTQKAATLARVTLTDTVTTLTNLPAITAGWLTATGIAADAITAAKVAADVGTEIATAVWANGTRTLTSISGLTADANVVSVDGAALHAHTAGYFPSEVLLWRGTTPAALSINGWMNVDVQAIQANAVAPVYLTIACTDYQNNGAFNAKVTVMAADTITSSALAASATAEIATAWGASVVGNSRTRDMYLQGMTNKVAFDVPGAGQYTIYASDDSTPLKTGTYTAAVVNPVTTLDPV